jgi:type II secretory ATPase GspE/PulE/Tfp pilus assembly ATPase PilB-like protein
MRNLAVRQGTQLLSTSAAELVVEGITSVREMNRVTYSID